MNAAITVSLENSYGLSTADHRPSNKILSPTLNLSPFSQSNKGVVQTIKHTISDEDIILGLQKADLQNKAFQQLMAKYQERLYMHIRRMVHEHYDADDVLQNTFIKVYRGIGNFKGESGLYTWLYRIATNECLTFLKKKKKRSSMSIESEDTHVAQQLKADTWFDGDEAQRLLKAAIATLPHKQQLVFNMRYYDEMSYKNISDVLGTSVGALKASYHHAAKKIEGFIRNNQ